MIFFFDLDGTLLTYEKTVSPKTMEAMERFAAAGHKIAVNTGRPVGSVEAVVRELQFPCHYFVGFNGSVITEAETGKVLFRCGIPHDIVRGVFDIAAAHHVYCHTYENDVIVTTTPGETLDYYRQYVKTPVKITDDIFRELTVEPGKCLVIDLKEPEKLEGVRNEVNERFGEHVQAAYSSRKYLEVFSREAGKGRAVLRLCELLDIPVSESYAAGDEQNDIPMLEAAGTGIAMLNAKEPVKAAADIITEADNNHDGLAPILLRLAETPA